MLLLPSILVTVIETTNAVFSPLQLPELHRILVEAAKLLNTEAPDLYIRQNPVPNAYTLAINGKKPFIVVHTSLVELLTRKELQVLLCLHTYPNLQRCDFLDFYYFSPSYR
jgi:Zn-dependent protease with chaperone function